MKSILPPIHLEIFELASIKEGTGLPIEGKMRDTKFCMYWVLFLKWLANLAQNSTCLNTLLCHVSSNRL
jgi:hypothetical protein